VQKRRKVSGSSGDFHNGEFIVFLLARQEKCHRWKGSNLQGRGILSSRSGYFPQIPRSSDCL